MIMTPSARVRETPRAVLAANFKRIAEALCSLEEYSKLIDVWLAGRYEVLRYDLYTIEKLIMTAVSAHRRLGDAKLMVLVGGLNTLGDLTWVVGEAPAGGADVIQYREKGLPDRELLKRAARGSDSSTCSGSVPIDSQRSGRPGPVGELRRRSRRPGRPFGSRREANHGGGRAHRSLDPRSRAARCRDRGGGQLSRRWSCLQVPPKTSPSPS